MASFQETLLTLSSTSSYLDLPKWKEDLYQSVIHADTPHALDLIINSIYGLGGIFTSGAEDYIRACYHLVQTNSKYYTGKSGVDIYHSIINQLGNDTFPIFSEYASVFNYLNDHPPGDKSLKSPFNINYKEKDKHWSTCQGKIIRSLHSAPSNSKSPDHKSTSKASSEKSCSSQESPTHKGCSSKTESCKKKKQKEKQGDKDKGHDKEKEKKLGKETEGEAPRREEHLYKTTEDPENKFVTQLEKKKSKVVTSEYNQTPESTLLDQSGFIFSHNITDFDPTSSLHEPALSLSDPEVEDVNQLATDLENSLATSTLEVSPPRPAHRGISPPIMPRRHSTLPPETHLESSDNSDLEWMILEDTTPPKRREQDDARLITTCSIEEQTYFFAYLLNRLRGIHKRRLSDLNLEGVTFFKYCSSLLVKDIYMRRVSSCTTAKIFYAIGSCLHIKDHAEQLRLNDLIKEGITKKLADLHDSLRQHLSRSDAIIAQLSRTSQPADTFQISARLDVLETSVQKVIQSQLSHPYNRLIVSSNPVIPVPVSSGVPVAPPSASSTKPKSLGQESWY